MKGTIREALGRRQEEEPLGDRNKSGKVKVRARVKADAVEKTARLAKRDPRGVSVRIHKRDGKIGEERAYPRRKDPSSSKG
jgi:hypothetical protein